SWTSDQGGSGTGALSDVIASLADGEVVTYEVTLSVPSDFTGDLVNVVSVDSPDVTDPTPDCPDCTDTDTPNNVADIVTVKTD
ncbi:hypothetical protein, partial [Joostella sp. CR20]|uniref:hypothetical protein n=1 Tax=Joostella sp. CR20 TaxID=2804312 RepID=UPI00313AA180